MSCHRSQKSINLHHEQVAAGRERKERHRLERLHAYWEKREDGQMRVNASIGFAFICFSYLMIATAVYLGYIMPAIVG